MVLILTNGVVTYIAFITYAAEIYPHIKFINQSFYDLIGSPGIAVDRKIVIDVFVEVRICQSTLHISSVASPSKAGTTVSII
ncbi:hypothetical protein D3C81_1186890 [compost metagenome]